MLPAIFLLVLTPLIASGSKAARFGGWPHRCGDPMNNPKDHVREKLRLLTHNMILNRTEEAFVLVSPSAQVHGTIRCNSGDCSYGVDAFTQDTIDIFVGRKLHHLVKSVEALPNGIYVVHTNIILNTGFIIYDLHMDWTWAHGPTDECADYVLTLLEIVDARCALATSISTGICPISTAAGGTSTTISSTLTNYITDTTTTIWTMTVPYMSTSYFTVTITTPSTAAAGYTTVTVTDTLSEPFTVSATTSTSIMA